MVTIRRSVKLVHLSGGQRQRIAFARAVYDSPAFVVLDEPNSNLDDAGEAALVKAVQELRARGTTVVVITHRTNIIAAVDKILLLVDGAVQMFAPKEQAIQALQQKAVERSNLALAS